MGIFDIFKGKDKKAGDDTKDTESTPKDDSDDSDDSAE
jgi:hypothetical protein